MLPTPLIPLPPESAIPPSAATTSDASSQDDLFATLFQPPTPHASPAPPVKQDTAASRPGAHTRNQSTNSDFGAFVSVPATDDPLGSGSSKDGFSPIEGMQADFFDRFAEDAKAANEKSKHDVLDELLKAENDPFYFLSSLDNGEPTASTSRHTTPIPSPLPTGHCTPQPQSEVSLLDLLPDAPIPVTSPSPSTSLDSSADTRQSRQLHRQDNRSELNLSPSSSRPTGFVRSPSLPPPTPPRPVPPEIQPERAQGQSFFSPPAYGPARWVSSLLSGTVRSGRTRSTDEGSALAHNGTVSAPLSPAHASTLPAHLFQSAALDSAITHGTPFAVAPFVPASGAPGFDGDRKWDKGFSDAYEKSNSERKSVRLVGRKEMTTPVLTVELADMLRPYFPALARLPRAWNLLYSLDQHGISLNTLYRRCENHTGGALVVMRDSGDAVFGVWMGQGIHLSKGAYYGSGESFLWRLLPGQRVRIYKWTGKNDYVALCEPEYLSFGGGDGHYGLYLDDTLNDGSSARCPTFENEPLCSAGPRQGENVRFECVGLEVWGVG
ncbi:TLD-domain-containing protein [Fomitopsis serialis]|uniref:TLD-domain-containing protein n=1 Tax=Fomitopsis serialis TaxID=139415 RepID=UPI0020082F7F|nr:TLD-domain-containing protein [Neoantrodia serialis]XP_047886460.1 TLD-domain-containing protein [Neoantrodia serialis]KAH9913202.1 TLD-domain-containing protein [Neoantrodia serialis]KAH9914279.1 TLD-domain-containing protein [Neoantrodia serialis]